MKNRDKDAGKIRKTKLFMEHFSKNKYVKMKKLCNLYTTLHIKSMMGKSIRNSRYLFLQVHYFFYEFNGARNIRQCGCNQVT
jgi:hypothetical protein